MQMTPNVYTEQTPVITVVYVDVGLQMIINPLFQFSF